MTFLFTDVEGSTRLWESQSQDMAAAVAAHDAIMREVVAKFDGVVFSTGGDSFAVAFARASDALLAAIEAQRALAAEPWPTAVPLTCRMGLNSGEAQERDGNYFGPTLNRAARLMAAGHGGQVLLSAATEGLVAHALPPDVQLVELGVHRLRDLHAPESVWQAVAPGLQRHFEPLRTLDRVPGNLPVMVDAFFGREADTERLRAQLDGHRLVTLVGVGGVGKTRLALQVAAEVSGRYPDGVWLCDLAPVAEGPAVPFTVGTALGLPERSADQALAALTDALAHRRALLVLDNCEHVIDSAADVAASLLQHCPQIDMIATSREGLAIEGEVVVPLKPLDPAGRAVVELFLDRARAAGVDPPAMDDAAVADICAQLDGIPLAVELAAARSRSMTAEEIASLLDQRFQLLGGVRRRAPGRHQTLKHTVDWSYALLEPTEQEVFDALGTFAGGFDARAAAAVTGMDVVACRNVLGRLVERSLVEADTTGHTTRYRLLETLRQYAHDRLVETGRLDAAARAHAAHFAVLAEEVWHGVRTPQERIWVELVDREVPNFRAALSWAVASDEAVPALRILAGLRVDIEHRRRFELGAWATEVAGLPSAADHPLRPEVLGLEAQMSQMAGRQAVAGAQAEAAIAEGARFGVRPSVRVYIVRIGAAWYRGDVERARQGWDEDLEKMTAELDEHDRLWARVAEGWAFVDDTDEARRHADALVADARRFNVPTVLAWSLYLRGTYSRRSDPPAALRDLDEATRIAREVRATYCADGATMAAVSAMALSAGLDERSTLERFDELIGRQVDTGDHLRLPTTLRQLALFLAERGRHAEAIVLRAAERSFPSQPIPATADPQRHLAAIEAAQMTLPADVAAERDRHGRELTLVEAARYARSVIAELIGSS